MRLSEPVGPVEIRIAGTKCTAYPETELRTAKLKLPCSILAVVGSKKLKSGV